MTVGEVLKLANAKAEHIKGERIRRVEKIMDDARKVGHRWFWFGPLLSDKDLQREYRDDLMFVGWYGIDRMRTIDQLIAAFSDVDPSTIVQVDSCTLAEIK